MTNTPATPPPAPDTAPKGERPKSERAGMWEMPPRKPTKPGYVRAEDLPPGALFV